MNPKTARRTNKPLIYITQIASVIETYNFRKCRPLSIKTFANPFRIEKQKVYQFDNTQTRQTQKHIVKYLPSGLVSFQWTNSRPGKRTRSSKWAQTPPQQGEGPWRFGEVFAIHGTFSVGRHHYRWANTKRTRGPINWDGLRPSKEASIFARPSQRA